MCCLLDLQKEQLLSEVCRPFNPYERSGNFSSHYLILMNSKILRQYFILIFVLLPCVI